MVDRASNFEAALIELLPAMRNYAAVLTRKRDAGDDLVQDTLVRALKSQHTFSPGTNLKAWIFTILRNRFISTLRRKLPEQVSDEGYEFPAAAAAQEHVVALRDLSRLLRLLPPRQREALLMIGVNGHSYQEAAAIVGSNVGTVKSRVSRARAFLQPHFAAAAPHRRPAATLQRDQHAGAEASSNLGSL